MTAGMAHHLVSRAIDVTQQHYNKGNDGEQPVYELPHGASILILATVVLFLATLSMVSRLAIPSRSVNSKADSPPLDILHLR